MGAMSVSISLGIFLTLSTVTFGLPQVSPVGDAPSSLIDSPWSQWMSLKAPPMAIPGGKSKKKKLLPGPAPPEGTLEAPWVSWTRMKVASALSPLAVPPPPASVASSSTNDSSTEPAIYIQWTQMKLPLTNPAVAQTDGQETPWDAWTNLKTGQVLNSAGVPPPALTKRMAPDRYNIASTAAPRLAGYASSQIPFGQQSGSSSRFPPTNYQLTLPSSASSAPSSSSSPRTNSPSQTYFDIFGVPPPITPMSSGAATGTLNSVNRPATSTPQSNPVPPASILATILKPIPHQIVSQLLASGTPKEIAQVVEAISSLNDEGATIVEGGNTLQVGHILPQSFLPKIPDELTPLLSTPLVMPPAQSPSELSLLPDEPVRQAILKLASPSEATAVLGTLSQIESLAPSEQAQIAQLQVKTVLPPSLLAKLQSSSPSLTPLLEKTLTPPILQKALPPPVLSAVLKASTPSEVATLVETLSKVAKLPPTYPTPMVGSILPPTVLAKLPPTLTPLLSKPVVATPPSAPTVQLPSPVLSSALPPPVYTEVVDKASPAELKDIAETIALLEAAVPAIASPPIISVIPPALLPKLSPAVKPLLTQPLVLPSTSPLTILPAPVLKPVLKVATPEEIPEIVENIAAVMGKPATGLPVKIGALLPPSVIAKLPPQVLPELETPISMIPLPSSATIPNVLPPLSAVLPKPVVQAVQAIATPEELMTLATTLTKLEETPPELRPLLGKLDVETILPPSLVAKLPPSILPLLKTPLPTPPPKPSTIPSTLPATIVSPAATILPEQSLVPKPILSAILATATPTELAELSETLKTIASVPPELKPLVESLELGTILPASLLPRLPPSVLPLLSTTLDVKPIPTDLPTGARIPLPAIPKPNPQVLPAKEALAPQPIPPEPLSTLSAVVPLPVLKTILAAATPEELTTLSTTLTKLEATPPELRPLIEKLDVETILPPSLVAKLPPPILPLLKTPLKAPLPTSSLVPSTLAAPVPPPIRSPVATIVSDLSLAPKPVLSSILATATLTELAELSATLKTIESVPPELKPLVGALELGTILPATLLPRLPPSVLPLLSTPIKLPAPLEVRPPPSGALSPVPVIAKLPPQILPETKGPIPVPPQAISTVLPPEVISTLVAVVPPPVLNAILSTATPEELKALAATVTKLEATPAELQPLIEKLEVGTILQPSLVAKLPPPILPLLKTPVKMPLAPSPVAATATPQAIPTPILETVVKGLSLAPKPVLNAILATATPTEITELSETLEKLEKIPPESKPLVESLELGTILPASLLPRLPPSVLPLLSTPIDIPAPVSIPTVAKPPPTEPISSSPPPEEIAPVLSAVISGLSLAPKPVLAAILGVAAPPELTELAETLSSLEAAAPLPPLPINAILPPSLLPKLPSRIAPLLAIPVTILPTNPALAPILSSVIPVISSAPKPVPTLILSIATPAELAELADTITKLEALPAEQKPLVAELELGTILPPSLKGKLPPPVLPLLSSPIVLPSAVEPSTPATIPPPAVLKTIPEPVLSPILSLASPVELKELAETLSKLEAIPPEEKSLLPKIPLVAVLPQTLIPKLPPALAPFLSQDLELSPEETTEAPLVPSPAAPLPKADDTLPLTPAEKKLLTKWAKVILEKTGNPAAAPPTPGEIPPLQAAWMEWVQLQAKKTAPKTPPATATEETTTDYPWTKWLKLKSNVTELAQPSIIPSMPPPLDVTTASPEKAVLDWLEEMEKAPTAGGVIPPPTTPLVGVSPVTEEKVAEILKELGIDIADLPPEQIAALLEELEKTAPPAPVPTTEVGPAVPAAPTALAFPPYALYPPPPFYSPFVPGKPFLPFWIPPASSSPFIPQPLVPSPPEPVEQVASPPSPSPTPPSPTINLTEYLIRNKMIPAETPPTASIPIPTLAKLLEEQALSTSPDSPAELTPDSTEHPAITAGELASLTPTKFAALLKQILKDCNRTNSLVPRSMMMGGGGPPSPFLNKGAYYKQKYAGWKKPKKRALYPIPSTAFIPQSSPSPVENLLPLPKIDWNTTGTVVDPAYWASQKSLFLSKLFSTLAKVATADSTTPSPKEQLTKQVNTVLMSDMTRSIKSPKHHHHAQPPQQEAEDDESEYDNEDDTDTETSAENDEDEQPEPSAPEGVNEKQLVTNDDSQPKLPKEPENPLHKLFKFGVQKTVLSDLSTPPPPQPYYVYITPPPQPPPTFDGLKEPMTKLKSKGSHDKTKKKFRGPSSTTSSRHHHSHSKKVPRFRTTTTTTTESPVDFELLAKALLMDKTGAKRSSSRK